MIDGKFDDGSCWLKFVNCARNEEEQNFVAFQYHGNIYYRSFKDIPKGSELFVWYGEQYARDLGISVNYSSGQHLYMYSAYATFFAHMILHLFLYRFLTYL